MLSDISCSFFKADGQTQSINTIYWKGIDQNTVDESKKPQLSGIAADLTLNGSFSEISKLIGFRRYYQSRLITLLKIRLKNASDKTDTVVALLCCDSML
ncbi:hypothetical protein [Aeribacillus composti]|uniref:hypothetical protein n=1 Tax=Aeribacillus composti TaxID=1868734 RepID=UPI002E248482|nr:hypothetical protein [Aeribacillus composti]